MFFHDMTVDKLERRRSQVINGMPAALKKIEREAAD
jgi:hypothetical protein